MKVRVKQSKSWTLLFTNAREYKRANWTMRRDRDYYSEIRPEHFVSRQWNGQPLTFSPDIQLPNSMEELKDLDPELYDIMTARAAGNIPVQVTLGFGKLETWRNALPIKVVGTTVPQGPGHGKYFVATPAKPEAESSAWLAMFTSRFLEAESFKLSDTKTYNTKVYYSVDAPLEEVLKAEDIKLAYLYHRYKTILSGIIKSNLEANEIRGVCRDLGIKIPVKLPAPDQYDWFAQEIFDGKYSNKQLHAIGGSFESMREALRPSITSVLASLA